MKYSLEYSPKKLRSLQLRGSSQKHDKWQYNEITKISQGIDDIKNTLLEDNIEKREKVY